MKSLYSISLSLLFSCFLAVALCLSCSSNLRAQKIEPDYSKFRKVTPQNPNITLTDYINRLPGISVIKLAGQTKVMHRGISTIYGENSPLFVVDGRRVGTSLRDLNLIISAVDIAEIRFMKAQEAGIRYGIRAGNGAIVINTK